MRNHHPEWHGYLAAFDAYVDARALGDEELQDQARTVMRWFSEALLQGYQGRERAMRRGTGQDAVRAMFSVLEGVGEGP